MYIEQIMSREVDFVSEEMKLSYASHLMDERGRQVLPVVDSDGRLVGLLTQKEVAQAEPSAITTLSVGEVNYLMSTLRVANVMVREVISCSPETLIEEAAQLMRQKKISSLPITDGERLVGIITDADILDFFLDITGCTLEKTTRIVLHLGDERGNLGHLLDDITELGAYIATVVSPYSQDESGQRTVILRFNAENPAQINRALRAKGYEFIAEPISQTPTKEPPQGSEAQSAEQTAPLDVKAIGEWMGSNDRFVRLLGIEVVDIEPGYAQARMVVRHDMVNSVEILQGGATFTLADFTFALASNSHGKVAVALTAQINFTAPAVEGETLTATARELNCGKRTALYSVEVKNGKDDLVAHFSGTVFRRDDTLQEWMAR